MSLKEDVEKVQRKVEAIEEESFALSILSDFKKQNKRIFIVLITVIILWFLTIGYLVYVLNDVGYEEVVTETYDVDQSSKDNGNNNFISGDNNEVSN